MQNEFIAISVSCLILFLVYFARLKSSGDRTFLFSQRFLNRADEIIFGGIKFIYKFYSLLSHNISTFFMHIPHQFIHLAHRISHAVSAYMTSLVEKITHKNGK